MNRLGMNRNTLVVARGVTNVVKRCLRDDKTLLSKKPCVIMCNDNKHVLCYHPEPDHPFEFTRPIERSEKTESIIKTDLANLFYKRFDNKPALTANEHWFGALRLAQEFNEHPITFKRSNRDERIKQFLEKTKPIKKNRESI